MSILLDQTTRNYSYFKLPIGYKENFAYGSSVISDLTNPIFVSKEERLKNQVEYENEWNQLLESHQNLLSKKDLINIIQKRLGKKIGNK